jgi:geranylgeranyl diphosphate synthase type I
VNSLSPAWDAPAFREEVRIALDAFLDRQAERLAPLGSDGELLLSEARACVQGGKRLRAAFCFWGFQAATPTHDEPEYAALIRACSALELLHASALVHDDYMDASATRRGRPATHVAFADAHRAQSWAGDPQQYGAASAILLGDLLLSWADEMLRTCGLPPDRVAGALDVFDLCRSEVIAGQFLDVSVQARGVADVDAAMRVLRFKSAKYSVERPVHIGLALAGADPDLIGAMAGFGLPLGEAFQLRDDLLGVFGDPAITGKPAGDDLVEGKRTVLVALALDAAPPGSAAELNAALGQPLNEAGVARLRAIIDASGAHAQVEQVIDELTRLATASLGKAAIDERARTALFELAAAATKRVD